MNTRRRVHPYILRSTGRDPCITTIHITHKYTSHKTFNFSHLRFSPLDNFEFFQEKKLSEFALVCADDCAALHLALH